MTVQFFFNTVDVREIETVGSAEELVLSRHSVVMATVVTEVGHSCGQDEPVGTSININGDKFMEIIFISTNMAFSENNGKRRGKLSCKNMRPGLCHLGRNA